MFRLPVQAVDLHALRACLPGEPATLTTTDEAVRLVVDLREVAVRTDGLEEFDRRLAEVRQRYARRRAFLDRLRRANPALVGDPARR
jgi:hypothetical protein